MKVKLYNSCSVDMPTVKLPLSIDSSIPDGLKINYDVHVITKSKYTIKINKKISKILKDCKIVRDGEDGFTMYQVLKNPGKYFIVKPEDLVFLIDFTLKGILDNYSKITNKSKDDVEDTLSLLCSLRGLFKSTDFEFAK